MSVERRMRPGATKLTLSALGVLCTIAACTGTSTKPLGSGDDLTVDVDATPALPDPRDEEASTLDSPYGFLDGPYGVYGYDAVAPVGACEQCACPSGTYCMGAGSGVTVSPSTCGPSPDGGGGAVMGVGCVPMPASCANEPDCTCLLTSLVGQLSCDPECVEVAGFAVYCTP